MNDRALGGLMLIGLGAGIAVLWYRGYFNDLIGKMTTGLAGAPLSNPIGATSTASTGSPKTWPGGGI